MKKIYLLVLFVVIFVVLAGIIFASFAEERHACTKMGCLCADNPSVTELRCNSCTSFKPVFSAGIFDVGQKCNLMEIVLCADSQRTGVRYDTVSCSIGFAFG